MTDRELSERINKSMATLKIIWGAILFSLLLYLGAGLYLSKNLSGGLSDPGTVSLLRAVLFAVSLVTLAVTKILRVKSFANARARGREGEGKNVGSAVGIYATATIVSLALSESIGIYGLVLSLLGGSTTDLFILVGLAAAAMVYYRPRTDEVMALVTGSDPGRGEYRSAQRD